MTEDIESIKPLTLKERIELLKQNQSNTSTTLTSSNNSTSTTSTSSTTTKNNKPKGIALIGLADVVPKSRSNEGIDIEKSEKLTTIESGGNISNFIDLTNTKNDVTNSTSEKSSSFSYPSLKSTNSELDYSSISTSSTITPTKIYSSPPIASPGSLQSILQSSIPSSNSSPSLISPRPVVSKPVVESIETSQITILPSSTVPKAIPTKPKWLAQSTLPISVVDSLPRVLSSSVSVPKLPPRSNSYSYSTPTTPILPPRPSASYSMSTSLSSTSTTTTPTKASPSPRPNRHRAPSADFESVSLSREDSVELAISLSPILDQKELESIIGEVGREEGVGGSPELKRRESSLNSTTNSNSVVPKLPARPIINTSSTTMKSTPSFQSTFQSSPPTTTPSISSLNNSKKPNQVSSSNITPSSLSTFSTRSPISPLAPRPSLIPLSNQRRYKDLFERLSMECLTRSKKERGEPAWIAKKDLDMGSEVGRLDGIVIKVVWELSGLKKSFLRDVWLVLFRRTFLFLVQY